MLTESIKEQVKSLYLKGSSYEEISIETGASKNQIQYFIQSQSLKRPIHLQKQGEKHNVSKLSDDDVFQIIKRYGNGENPSDIAPSFGISKEYIVELVKKPRGNEPAKTTLLRTKVKIRRPGRQ